MRIVGVCGSLAAESSNLRLLRAIGEAAGARAELQLTALLADLPLFSPERESQGGPAVTAWRSSIAAADAVVIACPEYGHSLPGALKNGIDWLIGSGELYGKRVAITAAVRHPARGLGGLAALRTTLGAVDARVVWNAPIVEDDPAAIHALFARLADDGEARPIVLYDFPISGNAWKVRTLLRRLERPFRIEWVDLLTGAQRQPAFLAKSPVGQVPVLELEDGTCLRDSSAILFTLAEHTALLPGGSARHDVLAWLSFEQTFLAKHVGRAIFHTTYPEVVPVAPPLWDAWRREGTTGLKLLDRHLRGRSFVVGESFTIADISLFAYSHRAEIGGFDLAPLAELRGWLARVRDEPGVWPIEHAPEA
jgi:glutathione S-transferase/NAD(P)H-dependent FMN reductase